MEAPPSERWPAHRRPGSRAVAARTGARTETTVAKTQARMEEAEEAAVAVEQEPEGTGASAAACRTPP